MKQRVTYLLPDGASIDPKDIHVGQDGVNVTFANQPAVEKRITAGLTELPVEVHLDTRSNHDLHPC